MNLLPLTIAAAKTGAAGQAQSPLNPLVMLVLFGGIFYFLMIRPQRRRDKERKEMINTLKSGSRVLLTSGIIGQVTTVKEHTLIVRISENTKIEVVRSAVSQLLETGETPTEIESTK